jgi:hypothetical protein
MDNSESNSFETARNKFQSYIALYPKSFLNKSFFEHLRPQYNSLRYTLTIRKNIVIFKILKLKLLHELTDGLTRLRKLPRLLIFFAVVRNVV